MILEVGRSGLTRLALALAAALSAAGCEVEGTGRLSPDREQRYESEGVTRRAQDLTFRYTRDPAGRGERWEDRQASIIVTRSSVLIHKNGKVGLEVTPRTQRDVAVQRSGQRLRVRTGTGRSEVVWSFEPPDDPQGWTTDIRAVINASRAGSTRQTR